MAPQNQTLNYFSVHMNKNSYGCLTFQSLSQKPVTEGKIDDY